MRKNVLTVALLGVLATELFFFKRDFLYFLGQVGTREVIIVLLVVGTVVTARAIKQAARRL
jgi:hypothetical protein